MKSGLCPLERVIAKLDGLTYVTEWCDRASG